MNSISCYRQTSGGTLTIMYSTVSATSLVLVLLPVSLAVKVDLLKPIKANGTDDVAIIITPGNKIGGLAYKPLGKLQIISISITYMAVCHELIFENTLV